MMHNANFVIKGITKILADETRYIAAEIKDISISVLIILKKRNIKRPGSTNKMLLFKKNNSKLSAVKCEIKLYHR